MDKMEYGEEQVFGPYNEVELQQMLSKPETKYLSMDITTAFYGKEGLEFIRSTVPLMAKLDAKGFNTALTIVRNVVSAYAAATKGTGNQAVMLTRLAEYRFRREDMLKDEASMFERLQEVLGRLKI